MDCIGCGEPNVRPDKPHTFFAHEYVKCPRCGERGEARIVLRTGQVWELLRCGGCGPVERLRHADAGAYVSAFLERGETAVSAGGEHLFKRTTSVCPGCLRLLEVDVVIRAGKVYFRKSCPSCGLSEALVSEDAAVARNNPVVLIDDDRRDKSDLINCSRQRPDLPIRVPFRIELICQ